MQVIKTGLNSTKVLRASELRYENQLVIDDLAILTSTVQPCLTSSVSTHYPRTQATWEKIYGLGTRLECTPMYQIRC